MAGKTKTELRTEILQLMREPDYRPLDKVEIANALGYGAARRNEVRRALRDLEKEGEIARIRKNRYVLPDTADLVTGALSVHEAGYASSVLGSRLTPDHLARWGDTGWAMLDLYGSTHSLPGGTSPSGAAISLNGLPVTGFMVYNIINSNAQPGKLANYSGLFRHRSTFSCMGADLACS